MDSASRHQHRSTGPATIPTEGLFVNAYGQADSRIVHSPSRAHFVLAAMQRQLDVVQSSLELDHALCTQDQAWVFGVADVRGAVEGGEPTSALAIRFALESLRETLPAFVRIDEDRPTLIEHALGEMVARCHQRLREQAPRAAGGGLLRGSCLTLAFVQWPHLFVAQVGDTQCYMMREGSLQQIAGEFSPVPNAAARNISPPAEGPRLGNDGSGRLLGGNAGHAPRPELYRRQLRRGDTLLLCTAGLIRKLGQAAIESGLQAEIFAKARCQSLLEVAGGLGIEDDVAVVVAAFDKLS